jgi:hypothetical protein
MTNPPARVLGPGSSARDALNHFPPHTGDHDEDQDQDPRGRPLRRRHHQDRVIQDVRVIDEEAIAHDGPALRNASRTESLPTHKGDRDEDQDQGPRWRPLRRRRQVQLSRPSPNGDEHLSLTQEIPMKIKTKVRAGGRCGGGGGGVSVIP